MKSAGSFVISEFTNPSGEVVFRVSGQLDGKRIRKYFDSRTEAQAERQTLELVRVQAESGVRPAATRLTDDQLKQAEAAFHRLEEPAPPLRRNPAPIGVFPAGRAAPPRALHSHVGSPRHSPHQAATLAILEIAPNPLAADSGKAATQAGCFLARVERSGKVASFQVRLKFTGAFPLGYSSLEDLMTAMMKTSIGTDMARDSARWEIFRP